MLQRVSRILRAFDSDHCHLALGPLARRAALPTSTASRLALEMVELGLLERNENGEFSVGLQLWEIAALADSPITLRSALSPLLDDLLAVTRQHLQLVIRDGEEGVVLDRRDGHADLPLHYHVGGRIPLAPTATGQILLAAAPPDLLEDMLHRNDYGWPTFECDRPTAKIIRAQIAAVRGADLAVLRRPTSPVVSVGVPVRDANRRVVAAIGILMARDGMPISQVEPLMRAAALTATRILGAGESPRPPAWSRR
ncbi:transcriptional regulator [Kineosporia sp. NBRC 101731]|nr:transcriptional regulator [Kineosporia sp. NBRC 101731]